MKRSKRYQAAIKLIDKKKSYSLAEAVDLIKKTATTKFDSSVEVHIHLGVDTKKADQQVRGTVNLPHPTGRQLKIAVFAKEADQKKAQAAGADIVGGEELIKSIKQTEKTDFDLALATPEMMRLLGQIAKILGTQGLMPNPKNETITTDIAKTIQELRGGKVAFRTDDQGNVHQLIGKASFESKILEANLKAFIDAIRRAKPEASKGIYLQQVSVNATMGPAIRVKL